MGLIKELEIIIEEGKKEAERISNFNFHLNEIVGIQQTENMIFCGDNTEVMKSIEMNQKISGKIKLIYIDPPFFSGTNYSATVGTGTKKTKHPAYDDKWNKGFKEYLKMLTLRLILMRNLLSEDGLLWIHLDWHAAHYVKVIMDEIFGEDNFINEIIWTYKSGGSSKRHFSRKHDNLLVYGKSPNYKFFPQKEKSYNRNLKPYNFKGVKEYKNDKGWYTLVNMKDVWNIDMVGRTSSERTGYATQKPEALMERIIKSCTEEGDLCADFFCGSGTFPAACSRMGRHFIACDSGSLAIEITAKRLIKQKTSFKMFGNHINKGKINIDIDIANRGETCEINLISTCEDIFESISCWSIDTNFDGEIYRPSLFFYNDSYDLETSSNIPYLESMKVCVKITDIFGNSIFIKKIM